jgi:hypothetical protein
MVVKLKTRGPLLQKGHEHLGLTITVKVVSVDRVNLSC